MGGMLQRCSCDGTIKHTQLSHLFSVVVWHWLHLLLWLSLSMGCAKNVPNLRQYEAQSVVTYLKPFGFGDDMFIAQYWQDASGRRVFLFAQCLGEKSGKLFVLSEKEAQPQVFNVTSGDIWVNDAGQVLPWPGWDSIAKTTDYAYAVNRSPYDLWSARTISWEWNGHQSFVKDGSLYLLRLASLRLGESEANSGKNCAVLKYIDGGWRRTHELRIPGAVEAVDPFSSQVVIREITDEPFWPRRWVYDIETGRSSLLGLKQNRLMFFLPHDFLAPRFRELQSKK